MASPRPDDSGCPDFERTARLDRRRLLEIGALYGLGFSLPELFRARAQAAPATSGTFGRARSVILLYLHGGHAQQETWDPKPDGPYPARGEFGAIATSVPGVRIGEGSVVGARSVVAADVPPFTVVAGNPARVIRRLTPEGGTRAC